MASCKKGTVQVTTIYHKFHRGIRRATPYVDTVGGAALQPDTVEALFKARASLSSHHVDTKPEPNPYTQTLNPPPPRKT